MTWLEFIPSVVMACTLMMLPGWLIVWAGGMRGFFAVAAAPVVSVAVVAGSAIIAGLIGVPFGLVPVALTLVAVVAVALAFAWGQRRWGRTHRASFPRAGWPWWIGLGVAVALWARHLRNVLGRPDSFSQTFDNVWHLNAVHYAVVSGDGSSLTIAHLNSSGGGFYPAAFHDFAALVTMANGGHLTTAVNAVAAVVCAVVWPLSVMFFVRTIFSPATVTIVGIGVLTASFTAFPLLFLDFGILYANLLGLAIVPVAIGVVAQLAGLGQDRWIDAPTGTILLVAAIPSLLLSHPNAFMLLLLVSASLMVAVIGRQGVLLATGRGEGLRTWVRVALAVGVIVLTVVLWPVLRPGTAVDDWPAPLSTPGAAGYALLNAPLGLMANWTVSVLMVAGLAVAASRRMLWLAGAWGIVVYFWLAVASFAATDYRLLLVGIWYNDSSRFAANLPILALPLAALGLDWLVAKATALWGLLPSRPAWLTARAMTVILAVAVAGIVVAGTQRTASMNGAVERAAALYRITDDSPLITTDEYRLLMRLPDLVPPDAVIANNPWNGSALAYALADREVTAPHMFYGVTPLREVVRDRLDEARTDPRVCPLLRQDRVRYVLDFGTMGVHGERPYAGLDTLTPARGVVEIAREGSAALYEITACG